MIDHLTVCIPSAVLSREHLIYEELNKFERLTGITKTRRWQFGPEEILSKSIGVSNIGAIRSDIASLIVITQSPSRLSPGMAVSVHKELQLSPDIPILDITRACDGFPYGLWMANKMPKPCLLICYDQLRFNKSPLEGLIFSDACVLSLITEAFVAEPLFYNEPNIDKLYCGIRGDMDMDGQAVFDFVTSKVPILIRKYQTGCPSEILVLHQANAAMNRMVELRSGFKGLSLDCINSTGNMSMCSIPAAIAINEEACLDKSLLLCGFGAGFSATLLKIKWPKRKIGKVVVI